MNTNVYIKPFFRIGYNKNNNLAYSLINIYNGLETIKANKR